MSSLTYPIPVDGNISSPETASEYDITTRAGKGDYLTPTEVDDNFLVLTEAVNDLDERVEAVTGGTSVVLKTDYNAHTILAATADDTPAALTIAEQTLVGRKTGGNIADLTATEARAILNVEDAADSTQNALESAPIKELLSDGDLFAILDTMEGSDSSEGEPLKIVSFSDLKVALKTYFDTIYTPL